MPDWDALYAGKDALFGTRPNEYVREICNRSDFDARSALCLADGDGRNGRWLAGQGLEVTAVDLSAVATSKACACDQAAEAHVERIVADLADWTVPDRQSWDAVFIMYLQCDAPTRERAVRLGADVLRTGGWLVLEAFAKPTDGPSGLGPGDRSVLYDLAELETWIPDLQTVEALSGNVLLDEGARHQGLAQVVRYAGRKSL